MKPAKLYSPKHSQTQTNFYKRKKNWPQTIQTCSRVGTNGLQQNQQGGSKILRNSGKVAAATIGSSLVNPDL